VSHTIGEGPGVLTPSYLCETPTNHMRSVYRYSVGSQGRSDCAAKGLLSVYNVEVVKQRSYRCITIL